MSRTVEPSGGGVDWVDIRDIVSGSALNVSGYQQQSSNQARESTRARQSSHFAAPSINPRGEFFHVFLSYRVADDEELVKTLYSKLQLDCKNLAIPLLEYSKFPHQFHQDLSNTADASVKVFLSARCLLDGEKWDWDARSKGGFVGALMQSCVFVPVFSCSIDDCQPGHDAAKIGNIARMARLAQPAEVIETWISTTEATQTHAAYLCFETASHSKRHIFLDGDAVEFDSYPSVDLPTFLSKGRKYFLVKAKDCPRSHNKFQRFLVSELKGGPPLQLQACSSKFRTKTYKNDWIDNVLLELLLAKEFHLQTKRAEEDKFGVSLRRCMTILPVVLCDMAELRSFINTFLSPEPSSSTIARAAEILNELQMSPSDKFYETSVWQVVNWYLDFQCIISKNIVSGNIVGNRLFSSEGDRASVMDHLLTVVSGKILDVVQRSVALGLMDNFEGSNPQAHEMITWLRSFKLGYYGSIFAAHGISSVRAVSLLESDSSMVPLLAAEGAVVTKNTVIAETMRLVGLISDAKDSELSLSLDKRAFFFKDSDASLVTMLYSSSAFILSLGNPLFNLILGCIGFGWLALTFIPATHMDTMFIGSYGSFVVSFMFISLVVLSRVTSSINARNFLMLLLWAFSIQQPIAYFFPQTFNDVEMLAATDDCALNQLSPLGSLVCKAYLQNRTLIYWILLIRAIFLSVPVFLFSLTLWRLQRFFARSFLLCFSSIFALNLLKCYYFYSSEGFVHLVVPIFCFSAMAVATLLFEGGRKGVIMWSKQKVFEDAAVYAQKLTELCSDKSDFPSFNYDRQQLSEFLNREFKDVWPNTRLKRLVLQEMDQISKIYAHSEFANSLFHDELTRIKDLCLSDSSLRDNIDKVSTSASLSADLRPPIELLRGPLKRPDRAISKVYRCYKGNFSHLSDTVRCVVVCDSIQHIQLFMSMLAKHSFTLADKPLSVLDRFLRYVEGLLLGRGGAKKRYANSWMEGHTEREGMRFHVLRVKNRFDPVLDRWPEMLTGGYRDINIKLKIGFSEGKNGRAELMTVEKWSSDESDNRIVCEVQVRLRAFHELLTAKQDMHSNYVLMRNLMSS